MPPAAVVRSTRSLALARRLARNRPARRFGWRDVARRADCAGSVVLSLRSADFGELGQVELKAEAAGGDLAVRDEYVWMSGWRRSMLTRDGSLIDVD
jgi:hypothetical protein